jgi:hypothetical protein
MSVAVKARVVNGHLVVNEPTDLPEGTELELVSVDDDDDMNDEDRAEVLRLIDEGLADVDAGNTRDFGAVIESLGKRP